jgi:hypothetical protein
LETVGLGAPARHIRDFSFLNVRPGSENYTSAKHASAADVVCRDVDVFGTKLFFLVIFYSASFFLLKYSLHSVLMYTFIISFLAA